MDRSLLEAQSRVGVWRDPDPALGVSLSSLSGADIETDPSVAREAGPSESLSTIFVEVRMQTRFSPPSRPTWIEKVLSALAQLLELPPNWDSYGARAASLMSVQRASELLLDVATGMTPEPQVVPTVRGGVQLEWRSPSRELEVHVHHDGTITSCIEDLRARTVQAVDHAGDISKLRSLVASLSNES